MRVQKRRFLEKYKELNEDSEKEKIVCPWLLYLSKRDKGKWVVKTFKDEHKCLQSRIIKHCTSTFLAKHITYLLFMNPEMPIRAIQEQMQKKFHVYVSRTRSFWAKAKAQIHMKGDVSVQYSLLRDYVQELKRCNPKTTVKIYVYKQDPENTTRMFRRIYVCLGALKRGFKESGRELLGLDGAFMKGQYPGHMLTVVGVDANNGIYPVAYDIVEYENTYFWTWFVTQLADDLDLFTSSNLTFITDMQKGLLQTIAKLFPSAECVRHIYENMNLTWKGGDYKEMLWRCDCDTIVVWFEKHMQELKDYNMRAYDWLKKIEHEHWSRSYFSVRAHCDLLINNVCEVFNRRLLEARDSPIIIALKFVREYLMKRIVNVQKVIQKCDGPLTPSVTKLLNMIKEASTQCTVDWNGADLFQGKGSSKEQYVVSLNQKSCSYRKWEVSGIPCKHTIVAIHDMTYNGMDVGTHEDWVHGSMKLQTWMNVYSYKINPVNGRDMWAKFDFPTTLLPPKVNPHIGRPPKNRKKSKGEIELVKGNKLTKKGKPVTCSSCQGKGHNKRICRNGPQAAQGSQTTTTKKRSATQGSQAASQGSQAGGLKRTKTYANKLTPEK